MRDTDSSPIWSGRNWVIAGIVGVLLGGLVAAIVSWSNPLSEVFSPGEGEYTDIGPVVVGSVRNLSELTTVEAVQSTTVEKGDDRGWLDWATGDHIFLFAVAKIGAGVDLGRVGPDDITVDTETGTVTLVLPDPEITSVEVDTDQTRVYDRDTGLFTSGDDQLESTARLAAEEILVDSALDQGLLDRAQESTELALTEFLIGLGYERVIVRFGG